MSSKSNSLVAVIGNKKYSSWSLRGWIAIKIAAETYGFKFIEILCPLAGMGADASVRDLARQKLLEYSPSGKVPCLIDNTVCVTVYDSIAILFYLADRYPNSLLLPEAPVARALCLSVSAEMHSGFSSLRTNWPMNCLVVAQQRGKETSQLPDVVADIKRLQEIFESCFHLSQSSQYLFGSHLTCADIMFAPVALRFRTYDPEFTTVSEISKRYMQTLISSPLVQEWIDGARGEGPELNIAHYDSIADK